MKSQWLGLVAVAALAVIGAADAAGVPGQGTWETTLQARDLDENGTTDAFYDTALNITWLRNADVNGLMDWDSARNWANGLVFGAHSDWRLPTMMDTGRPGCDYSYSGTDCGYNVQTKSGDTVYSEMAHLYYVALGNTAAFDTEGHGFPPGWGLSNTGGFQNLHPYAYWSGLEYSPYKYYGWFFHYEGGSQFDQHKMTSLYAMAVHPGDVGAPVPEPQTLVLMLAGLTTVMVVRRLWSR